MIETLDTSVRLVAVGATLLLLVLLLAGEVRRPIKIALAGLLLGAVAYLFNSAEGLRPSPALRPLIDLGSVFAPFWIWLFARHLFEREPPPLLIWTLAAALIAGWLSGHYLPGTHPAGFYLIHAIGLALVADLFRVALAGRDDDLVERRRPIRLWLPILVAAQSGGILLYEVVAGTSAAPPPVQLVNASLILAIVLFAGLALLRTDPDLLVETETGRSHTTDRAALSPSEQVLHDKLRESMDAGYYRTPGLTITGLAEHLGVPEHRLRALVNQRLGHRNFSAFLNRHRIGEACAILADRDRVDLPVLTIAMDLGYNSLATFNRAFRTETGTTPTDYRRERLGGTTGQN
ncbi:helix-turn-helix domain-containing protein [Altererythrobacter sp. Z27]|uniref:helix-turn-helix domain-containing protein n=1 Tax=Altererythrobacter sp. Z27 TaxID=3461147 RepID=UPI00404464BF